ncbi:MAG: ribbon-helix-helix domain-containing protein [Anaerolineales bacterium]|nr:ribbon-helix-helix domain-containing protein [Anaerolineales bacterium]
MTETMVRTQVYLPRSIYQRLRERADRHDVTLAMQIRAALESYLRQAEADDDGSILHPDNPIFSMMGSAQSDVGDASIHHDYYLYGAPKVKPAKPLPKLAVREKARRPYTARLKNRKKPR